MKRLLLILAFLAAALSAQTPVTLSPQPRLYFVDTSGSPCVGCYLYSYAAGTMTPQATYIDSTGTTQNANPIVLDSQGSASVWLAGLSYKLALQDASHNPIWTVDNVKSPYTSFLPLAGGTVTGPTTFNAAVGLGAGGSFSGTFTGAPTMSGNWAFSGNPTFTGAPTFNYWTSLTTNPAQSGQLRLADSDSVCWRNTANSADNCLLENNMGQLQIFPLVSNAANPAQSGIIALATSDVLAWRNFSNNADIPLGKDSSDDLTWNGHVVATLNGATSLRYSATTPASVSNSSSQTTLESVTYNAGDINAAGRTFTADASLYGANTSGGSEDITVYVYLGTTSLCQGVFDYTNNLTGGINVHVAGVVTVAGGSGSIEYGCSFSGPTALGVVNTSTGSSGSVTVNTTNSQAISVQVALGTASADLSANNHVLNLFIQ